jgi:hypothetical protein
MRGGEGIGDLDENRDGLPPSCGTQVDPGAKRLPSTSSIAMK